MLRDADDFSINSDGELTFAIGEDDDPPNFEAPADTGGDNVYNVTVQSTDRGLEQQRNWFKVVVTVVDVEEVGKITWIVDPDGEGNEAAQNLLQFQSGAVLTASLTDPDRLSATATDFDIPDAGITWRWYRASTSGDDGTVINTQPGQPEATNAYTPTDSPAESTDVGSYIRVEATYTDARGSGKKAEFVSAHPVQPYRINVNLDPRFAGATATRRISET